MSTHIQKGPGIKRKRQRTTVNSKRAKREMKVVDSVVKQRELSNMRFWPGFPGQVLVGSSVVAAVATKNARVRGSASVPRVEGKQVQVQVVHAC